MKITINLLPENKKEEVRIQYLIGMVLNIGSSAFFAILVFSAFLFSCFFIIDLQGKIIEDEINRLNRVDIYGEVQKTRELVNEYYKNTDQLEKSLNEQISHVAILEKINELMPKDLFLQEISIADGKVLINGFSSSRNSLIDFRDRLEKEEKFEKVEAPISNFTASENINFNFTIGIKK